MTSTWYWPQLKGGLAPDRSSVIVAGWLALTLLRRAESTYCCCATSHSAMPENPSSADEVGGRLVMEDAEPRPPAALTTLTLSHQLNGGERMTRVACASSCAPWFESRKPPIP